MSKKKKDFKTYQRLLWCKKKRLDRSKKHLGKRFDLCFP